MRKGGIWFLWTWFIQSKRIRGLMSGDVRCIFSITGFYGIEVIRLYGRFVGEGKVTVSPLNPSPTPFLSQRFLYMGNFK